VPRRMSFETIALLLGGVAALLVGFSKTGMPGVGLVAVALMAEAFRDDAKLSVGAILPLLIVGDLFAITYYRRHADWRRLWQLFPWVVGGAIPAYLVLWRVEGGVLRVLIGAIILLLLAVQFGRKWLGGDRLADRAGFVAATGVLAGFATTVSNAAGPVMSIYLVSKRLDKLQFMGTAAWFFFFVNVSKIPLYSVLGMITPATLRFNLLLVPAVLVGVVCGVKFLDVVPQRLFDTLVLVFAGVAAVRMIVF
jgi:uncharacterized membrane protein YfcA